MKPLNKKLPTLTRTLSITLMLAFLFTACDQPNGNGNGYDNGNGNGNGNGYNNGNGNGNGQQPVSQTVTITIPGFNDGYPVFEQMLSDGDTGKGAVITITSDNKTLFDNAITPTVQFGTAASFTAGNRPAFTVQAVGGQGGQTITTIQSDNINAVVNSIVSQLSARNVNAAAEERAGFTIDNGNNNGDTISLGSDLSGILDGNTLTINWSETFNTAAFNINDQKLQGKNIAVVFNPESVSSGQANISLTAVHHLRQALLNGANAASSVSVNADEGKFTPTFSSREWLTIGVGNFNQAVINLYDAYSSAQVYSDFASGGIEIMNNIKVFRHPSDNKYMIAYNRPIKLSDIALGVDNGRGMSYPFHGFGLKKEAGGNISSVGNSPILIHGGAVDELPDSYCDNIVDFTTYESLLKKAGLYPSATLQPDHSLININAAGTNGPNVAANGMLDFIYAYYNPDATGTVLGADLSVRLPAAWPAGLTFDGRFFPGDNAAALGRRIVGLDGTTPIDLDNTNRKGTTGISGEPNTNFVGNITVDMANLMSLANNQGDLGISEFRNTNIIGNSDRWNGISSSNNLRLDVVNVGLVGNYATINTLGLFGTGEAVGVVDILGTTSAVISSGTGSDNIRHYINLWNDVSGETQLHNIHVAFLKNAGGKNVYTGIGGNADTRARLIIYTERYNNLVGLAQTLTPHHRAFVDKRDGQVRFTGVDSNLTGIDPIHIGTNNGAGDFAPILSPNEEDWINAANGITTFPSGAILVNGVLQLAANYNALGSDYKWASFEDFINYTNAD